MTLLRWIFFVPIGFVASIVAGGVFEWMGPFLQFGEAARLICGGGVSAIVFFIAGMWIAPERNRLAKYALIVPIVLLGLISGIGGLLGEHKLISATGFSMAIVGIGLIRLQREEIDKMVDRKDPTSR